MSSESLGELKAIIDNAPYGTVGISDSGFYINDECHTWLGGHWFENNNAELTRSLSDIERVIELMEQVKACYEAYSRIESIKQKYNAENKQLKERLDKYE